jgi:hypothetical protein
MHGMIVYVLYIPFIDLLFKLPKFVGVPNGAGYSTASVLYS